KVTYFTYKHPVQRHKADRIDWTWHKVLMSEARIAIQNQTEELSIGWWAPIGVFNESSMSAHLVPFRRGMVFEIELPPTDKMRTQYLASTYHPVWVAEIIHTIGYYILLRWCGARHSDGFFWIHSAHLALHSVGFTAANESIGCVLVPPEAIF
ncbi:hypothetical protein PMAYCL1PPCAC_01706, partial [Pristionchus mayeri]